MSALVILYWFALGFLVVFTVSAAIGASMGFGVRESVAVALGHALLVCLFGLFLYLAITLGLHLMEADR